MSVEVKTNCVVGGSEIRVDLYFTEDDPASVVFQFFNKNGESQPEWVFGRDLLKEVLESNEEVGLGDVRIEAVDKFIVFNLTSPDGKAIAVFTRAVIEDFVEFVYDEVPEGEDEYEIPDGIPEDWPV